MLSPAAAGEHALRTTHSRRFLLIVTLGGALGLGTKTASVEWNIMCDPDAAAIVYGSGIPISMVPIDASGMIPIDAA